MFHSIWKDLQLCSVTNLHLDSFVTLDTCWDLTAYFFMQRKSLLEVIKETVLSHLTKKCPPQVRKPLLEHFSDWFQVVYQCELLPSSFRFK